MELSHLWPKDELSPRKAHMTVFYSVPKTLWSCSHSPPCTEQPKPCFKTLPQWFINNIDGGIFPYVPDFCSLTSPSGPRAWQSDGKPHQPPKSSWVNTPSSLAHTPECCACPKTWSGGRRVWGGIWGNCTHRRYGCHAGKTPPSCKWNVRPAHLKAPPVLVLFILTLHNRLAKMQNEKTADFYTHAPRCTERLTRSGYLS